jgi:microcystin degradation protein MlrC
MAEELEKAIQAAQEDVAKQGDVVRSLKASLKDGKAEKVLYCMIAQGFPAADAADADQSRLLWHHRPRLMLPSSSSSS